MLDRTALSPNKLGLFGMVPRRTMRRLRTHVPRTQVFGCIAVYTALAVASAEQGSSSTAHGQSCVVATGALAYELGCSPRTIQRHVRWLVAAGVLSVLGQSDRLGWTAPNRYLFLYPQEGVTRPAAQSTSGVAPGASPVTVDAPAPGNSIDNHDRAVPRGIDQNPSTDSAKAQAREWLKARRATAATSAAGLALPVGVPVGVPVVPVAVPVVPAAAPGATEWSRSPAGAAPIGSPPDRTETGSPDAAPPVVAGFPCEPVPAPPRPPERSGRPVHHPVRLASLLGAFPVRPVGGLALPVARLAVPVRPPTPPSGHQPSGHG